MSSLYEKFVDVKKGQQLSTKRVALSILANLSSLKTQFMMFGEYGFTMYKDGEKQLTGTLCKTTINDEYAVDQILDVLSMAEFRGYDVEFHTTHTQVKGVVTLKNRVEPSFRLYHLISEVFSANDLKLKPLNHWPDLPPYHDIEKLNDQVNTLTNPPVTIGEIRVFVDGEESERNDLIDKYGLDELNNFVMDAFAGDLHDLIVIKEGE